MTDLQTSLSPSQIFSKSTLHTCNTPEFIYALAAGIAVLANCIVNNERAKKEPMGLSWGSYPLRGQQADVAISASLSYFFVLPLSNLVISTITFQSFNESRIFLV